MPWFVEPAEAQQHADIVRQQMDRGRTEMIAAHVDLPHRLDLRVPGEAEGGAEREVDRRVLVAPERDRESGLGIADRRVGVERRRHGRSQQRGNCQESEKGLTHFQTRSEEHTSELQSLMRISYAVFCLKKKPT